MEKYLVSICIPTYNRANYLSQCINSIVAQKEFIEGKVEIVISDNASTDNTQQVAARYIKQFENIKYFRNEVNVRDQNFPMALLRGNGILRRLSNDTRIYLPGSMKLFCDAVEKYEKGRPLLFFYNGKYPHYTEAEKHVSDLNSFLWNVSFQITWIGALSLWDSDVHEIKDHMHEGVNLWQMWLLCHMLAQGRDAVIFCKYWSDTQEVRGKDISYGLFETFYTRYLSILRPYLEEGKIQGKCWAFLEKDLLFRFFYGFLFLVETHTDYKVSKTESLKTCVYNTYKDKPYFWQFQVKYQIKKIKIRLKKLWNRQS